MNKKELEKMFDEFIDSYELDDNFNLLSAVRRKYGDVALDEFLEFIKSFVFQKIIHEVLKNVTDIDFQTLDQIDKYRKKSLDYLNAYTDGESMFLQKIIQKAKELYDINL